MIEVLLQELNQKDSCSIQTMSNARTQSKRVFFNITF